MNLSNREERRQLIERARDNPPIYTLLVNHLQDYVRLFKWPDFHTVYQGGMLSIQGPNKGQFAFRFESLLEITGLLTLLEQFPGFQSLMEGFRNPTQISATLFEVQVAAWCATKLTMPPMKTRSRPTILRKKWDIEQLIVVCG